MMLIIGLLFWLIVMMWLFILSLLDLVVGLLGMILWIWVYLLCVCSIVLMFFSESFIEMLKFCVRCGLR